MIQAVVGMWRKVGIEANIEIYEIAKHYELRARHELAPAAFYNWGNSIGDPSTSTGFAMFGPSPHSAWKTEDVDKMIGPLWGEKDEAKRIAGYKAVDRYIAEQGYVLPLLQYKQPVVYRKGTQVHAAHRGVRLAAERASRASPDISSERGIMAEDWARQIVGRGGHETRSQRHGSRRVRRTSDSQDGGGIWLRTRSSCASRLKKRATDVPCRRSVPPRLISG